LAKNCVTSIFTCCPGGRNVRCALMPVIRIQAIRNRGVDVAELLKDVSVAVAKAFSIESAQCWSCFTEIQPGGMFEGATYRSVEQSDRHSPLVTIFACRGDVRELRLLPPLRASRMLWYRGLVLKRRCLC
jgi:hypothetical protein